MTTTYDCEFTGHSKSTKLDQ